MGERSCKTMYSLLLLSEAHKPITAAHSLRGVNAVYDWTWMWESPGIWGVFLGHSKGESLISSEITLLSTHGSKGSLLCSTTCQIQNNELQWISLPWLFALNWGCKAWLQQRILPCNAMSKNAPDQHPLYSPWSSELLGLWAHKRWESHTPMNLYW